MLFGHPGRVMHLFEQQTAKMSPQQIEKLLSTDKMMFTINEIDNLVMAVDSNPVQYIDGTSQPTNHELSRPNSRFFSSIKPSGVYTLANLYWSFLLIIDAQLMYIFCSRMLAYSCLCINSFSHSSYHCSAVQASGS